MCNLKISKQRSNIYIKQESHLSHLCLPSSKNLPKLTDRIIKRIRVI